MKNNKQHSPDTPLSLVVLISGNGSNLQAIIDAIESNQLQAKIAAVISNQADAQGLKRAEASGITTHVIEHNKFPDRETYDAVLLQEIESYHPDLVVLAGFMRILTDSFVRHFYGRMINIHPSLLPRHRGLNTHRRALEAGDKEHGLTIHFVSCDLDSGPVIHQVKVPVRQNDDESSLAQRVLEQEHIAYPEVIGWFARKKISLNHDQVLIDGNPV